MEFVLRQKLHRLRPVNCILFILAFVGFSSNFEGIDHCLAQQNRHQKSIGPAVEAAFRKTPIEGTKLYNRLKKAERRQYNFGDENELNNLGYKFLGENKTGIAIAVFKLAVKEFPDKANPYDSLGEAYLKAGDKSNAIKYYQIALKMDPENARTAAQVDRLLHPTVDKTKFGKTFSKEKYLEDIEFLVKQLTTRHPDPFRFTNEKQFRNIVENKKQLIVDETKFEQFYWHCQEIVASLDCSHTSMAGLRHGNQMLPVSQRFPIDVRLIGNRLFVFDPLENSDRVVAGQEITKINGLPIEKIRTTIFKHIQSQGKIVSFKRKLFNVWPTGYLSFGLGFPENYYITLRGSGQPISLKPLKTFSTEDSRPKPSLSFSWNSKDNYAVLTIRSFSFYGNQVREFQDYLNRKFEFLKAKKISRLIVDLRGNGGGSSEAGSEFLKYFRDKPFVYFKRSRNGNLQSPVNPGGKNRFQGKVAFIIDGAGGSTTGHVVSLIKEWRLGPIIGEELGSNKFCVGGQICFRLPNTQTFVSVARYIHETTAESQNDHQGVMPTFPIASTINDLLEKRDPQLEFAKGLLLGQKKTEN